MKIIKRTIKVINQISFIIGLLLFVIFSIINISMYRGVLIPMWIWWTTCGLSVVALVNAFVNSYG